MRSLKRPLSILIAALMLVSVMVIAPVTASATVTASGTINAVGRWVGTENITYNDSGYDYMIYPRNTLGDRIIVTRMNPDGFTEPSWDKVWNQTDDLTIPADTSGSNGNWLFVSGYSGNNLTANWNSSHHGTADDDYVCVQIFNDTASIKQYVWTYDLLDWTLENGVLTISGTGAIADVDHDYNLPWYSHLDEITTVVVGEGITGVGNNVLAGCESKRVSLPSTLVSFDVNAYKEETLTRDGADPMSDFAPSTFKKLETLGVQERTVDNAAAFRFVTVADSGLLKAADDYGYIMASTSMSKDEAMSAITDSNFVVGSGTKKYSCKGTSNNFAGDYGSSDLTATGYKYISCIVTGAASGNVVVSRFYITLDGTTYTYAPYSTYNGCAYALS